MIYFFVGFNIAFEPETAFWAWGCCWWKPCPVQWGAGGPWALVHEGEHCVKVGPLQNLDGLARALWKQDPAVTRLYKRRTSCPSGGTGGRGENQPLQRATSESTHTKTHTVIHTCGAHEHTQSTMRMCIGTFTHTMSAEHTLQSNIV